MIQKARETWNFYAVLLHSHMLHMKHARPSLNEYISLFEHIYVYVECVSPPWIGTNCCTRFRASAVQRDSADNFPVWWILWLRFFLCLALLLKIEFRLVYMLNAVLCTCDSTKKVILLWLIYICERITMNKLWYEWVRIYLLYLKNSQIFFSLHIELSNCFSF